MQINPSKTSLTVLVLATTALRDLQPRLMQAWPGAVDGQFGLPPGSGGDQAGCQVVERAGRTKGALVLCMTALHNVL